jgi:glycosyltransferase involved in cell wall biosynthesis
VRLHRLDFSRQAILERYGLPEDHVVDPNAVDPRYKCLAPGRVDKVREKYRLESPFVLSVGRLEPRKNLERLIRAFDRVRRRMDPGLELVIVGKEDFRHEAIHREAERLPAGTVRFLGPVPDEDLPALYNLASVLAYPSLVEGFGMPVLEAMACGTPVVASPRGALPEVGGEVLGGSRRRRQRYQGIETDFGPRQRACFARQVFEGPGFAGGDRPADSCRHHRFQSD